MPQLVLSFLGGFQAKLDDAVIPHFRSANAQGLLVYCALQAERPFPRETLAALFWPDLPEAAAKKNLRQALYQLRQLLPAAEALAQPHLLIHRQSIQFNVNSDYHLDVQSFLAALEVGDLATAVALYHGELLAGFTCDSLEFEAWLRQEREHLHRLALQAMTDLAERQLAQGKLNEAQTTARRQLALEPWQEAAHRQLMQALALNGDRSGALAQYELCRAALAEELGVAPAAETVALAEQIKADGLPQPDPDLISGRYALAEPIGQGAMGIVYRGQDTRTGEPVAVKMLDRSRVEGKPELVERFRREGEALRQLNHPNIVKMLAIDEKDGRHFLVMEYVEGGDLQRLLQGETPLTLTRVLTIALDLADALTRAHRLKILHRDLKPANVLLGSDGVPRLSDFGIARLGDTSDLTQTGAVMGTIAYLSPEACMGEVLDERSDIWAFGVLLYEMLAGARPFSGQTPGATLYAILNSEEKDISLLRADVPDPLRELLRGMLTKNREERIPSVRLVGAALEALLTGTDMPLVLDTRPPPATSLKIAPPPEPIPERSLPTPFQAPPAPPHFVGRDTAVAELAALVTENKQSPNITALVGMGGAGKTTCAAALAARLKNQFPDGVLWANVKNSETTHILELWGRAYDHDFSGLADGDSRATAVRTLLADKQTLIVLDNVEEAAQARPLLLGGAGCAVLLTTRNLEIAAVLNARPYHLAELTPGGSRQLLISILGQERVFATGAELTAADEIGRLLHHLPLAVEIAAQRLKSRPRLQLAQMADRLQSTQRRLGLALSDSAVRASFQVSWEGLEWHLQQLFAVLAVFGGRPFTSDAATAVAAKEQLDVEDDLYTLAALSLVEEVSATHFKQHPLLADFAAEHLQEREQIDGRFAVYFLSFARENSGDFQALDPEWENMAAAVRAAYDLEEWQTVLEFTEALAADWLRYGRYSDANQAYALAQSAAENLESDSWLAKTILGWAELGIEQSNYEVVWQQLQTIMPLLSQPADNFLIAKTEYFRGYILYDRGEYDAAEQALLSSIALLTQPGEIEMKAIVNCLLARVYFEKDDTTERALQLAQKSLALLKETQSENEQITVIRLLTRIQIQKGDLDEAESYANQAYQLSARLKNKSEMGAVYYQLIAINMMRQNYEQAEKMAEEGLVIFRHIGNKRYEGMVLHELSVNYLRTGRYSQAKLLTEQSLDIFQQIQDKLNCGYALRQLGDIYMQLEQPETGLKAWQEAREIADSLDHSHLQNQLSQRMGT